MLLTLLAAAATCVAPDASALLSAYRQAAQITSAPAIRQVRYAYSGEGLDGEATNTIDEASGVYVYSLNAGIVRTATGFDGRRPWRTDLSGSTIDQTGGNKVALALSEAYRNANLWWREDRGGADIDAISCDTLRVTPRGGMTFEASFDPTTHLLSEIRETQTFATERRTLYSDWQRTSGRMLPSRVVMVNSVDMSAARIYVLKSVEIEPGRADARFAAPTSSRKDWYLPAEGRTTASFELLNNHIIVPVRVNGGEARPFLLDTGGVNILTPAMVRSIGLKVAGVSKATGGGEGAAASGYVRVDSLQIGGAVLKDVTAASFDFSPPEVEGIELGGMIGAEFLQRFVVTIDYGANTVTFIDPARFTEEEQAQAGIAIPFRYYEHLPQIQGTLDGRPALINIDTGSRSDVNITSAFVERAGLRQAYPHGITTTEGWGAGGPARAYIVRLGELSLGSVRVLKPLASLSAAKRGAFADAAYDGNLGGGVLKRFVATFDYSRHTLFLNTLAQPDADVGRFDRVGIWVNHTSDGVRIMDVAEGGPAFDAGLQVGDVVVAIDGIETAGRSLSDVRRSLKLLPIDRSVPMIYSRNGVRHIASIRPRDLVPES